jgi:hypothetical protein
MKYSREIAAMIVFLAAAFNLSAQNDPAPNSNETPASATSPSDAPSASATQADGADITGNKPKETIANKRSPVHIPVIEKPPVIDGQLDDAIWGQAAVFKDFLQTEPGDNTAPSYPTDVLMAYDSKNLYVAFRVHEPKEKIRATVARRDNIFSDDYVGVYLDTFNDQRQAYCLFFNPLGVQADGVFREGKGEDYSVDIVMDSKGTLTPDGFTIEVAIPFKSLRYISGKEKAWGIHLFRRFKDNNNELDSWMPNDRSVSGSLSQAGHLSGIEGVEAGHQLELIPSVTISETGRRTRFTFNNDLAGRFVNEGVKGDFGLTAKLGLTPTITLDFAYNPDFAQVEADAPVSTVNVRFPIFFPEKRPFFLERIEIFQSQLNLVNTRTIVDPDIAAKITGRQGKNTFGIMYASDNALGNFSPDERQTLLECQLSGNMHCRNARFVDQNADIGVLRFKRDIGKENNLGFLATTYNFVDHHNNAVSFDGRFRFDPKTVGEFQIVGTTTRGNLYDPYLDRVRYRTGNGIGYNFYLERGGRNWYMNYLTNGRSRDYVADVGFTERTDTNYVGVFHRYQTDQNAHRFIQRKRIQNATNITYNWSGSTQYLISDTNAQLTLPRQTYVGGNVQWGYERDFEREFRPFGLRFFGPDTERSANFKAFQTHFETTPTKQLYLSWFQDFTAGLMDYDFGGGPRFGRASLAVQNCYEQHGSFCEDLPLDPGPGSQLWIQTTIRYQPTTAFQTQLDFTRRKLVRHDTGRVAFLERIYSSRSTYQFSRNTFARLRVDYSTLTARLRPQLVVGWTPNPGTAFYVGYNDDFNYGGFNPFTGDFERGLHGNGRSFFIKASYLFKRSF